MALPRPTSLSPSKVSSFTSCPLQFRFSQIHRLPEPPSEAAVRGTLVHKALEQLFWNFPAGRRTKEAATEMLNETHRQLAASDEYAQLNLSAESAQRFYEQANTFTLNYFQLEDPNRVEPIGLEIMITAPLDDGVSLRGIIDRLDLNDDKTLTVTDYKTGRAPSDRYETKKLEGVFIYAYLCEAVLGVRPKTVQLLHLAEPVAISTQIEPQKVNFQAKKSAAVWGAIARSCANEDFRPKPGPLCNFCAFRDLCPAQGGDIARLDTAIANARDSRKMPGQIHLIEDDY